MGAKETKTRKLIVNLVRNATRYRETNHGAKWQNTELMIDDKKLMKHLKKTTEFNMSLKKAKWKLQRFLEYHTEMTNPIEIRRDFKKTDGVKLPKNNFENF